MRHLLEHDCFRESADLPTLIIGDFNDWRNTLARLSFASQGFEQLTVPTSGSVPSPPTSRSSPWIGFAGVGSRSTMPV